MDRRSFIKISSVVALVSVAGYKLGMLFRDVAVKAQAGFGLSFPARFPITFQETGPKPTYTHTHAPTATMTPTLTPTPTETPTPTLPSGGIDEHILHLPFISRD